MSVTPTFQGEVQMRRWSDSSTQGVQVTFALPDSSDLEPLKAKAGKRFMAVLVEIGDDELPIPPDSRGLGRKDTRGQLCREACDLCAMPKFQRWAMLEFQQFADGGEQGAKAAILEHCGVLSRKELDEHPTAGQRFISGIRVPFMRYMALEPATKPK